MEDDRSAPKTSFRLHYFPKIPIMPQGEKGNGIQEDVNFRRTDCRKHADAGNAVLEKPNADGLSDRNLESGKAGHAEQRYAKGYRDGLAAGIKAEKERLDSHLNHLRELISQIEAARTEIFRSAEKEIIRLAMAIATKITRHEISVQKDVILRVVGEALKKSVDHDNLKIRVNPADYHLLQNRTDQLSSFTDKPGKVVFVEDETIERGGCVIETNLGDVDARIEKQLQTVEAALKAEFRKSDLTNRCSL
jgi:flagellar assembly protein FliH